MTYVGLYLLNILLVCSGSLQTRKVRKGCTKRLKKRYKPQIGVLGRKEVPGLTLPPSESGAYGLVVDNMLNCITDEASATSDKHDGLWLLYYRHERKDGEVTPLADLLLTSLIRIMI